MAKDKIKKAEKRISQVRWMLVMYDMLILAALSGLSLLVSSNPVTGWDILWHFLLAAGSLLLMRFGMKVYRQIWRYGGIQCYLRIMISDSLAFIAYYLLQRFLPVQSTSFVRCLAFMSTDLVIVMGIRMVYRFIFKRVSRTSKFGKFIFGFINIFGQTKIKMDDVDDTIKIKIAIVGAGRIGTGLAEELLKNPNSSYTPKLFIDHLKDKIGREIYDVKVIGEDDATDALLKEYGIQEIVFAVMDMDADHKKELYQQYKTWGYRVKTYDFPTIQNAEVGSKRHLRDFDPEELLFRKPLDIIDDKTKAFYKDKVILITGGGGSIGSELCRQVAKMEPKQIVILDIYENCAYDVQQELKMKYGAALDLKVEIISITNRPAMDRVFAKYHPNIVIMAAAHKHVPLMENNVVEAVENNVFGTLNTVELAEKYGVDRVHMVSTDKAVNPTSVMGATKRICEMICQSHSTKEQHTTFSMTRFGNVLGSAGSVIPLFKRQIANGGPVTLTDKRIIRYFMTIPEASQLVLASASMAKNGELFVLDMGQPVKIYDLAVNMIKLSGFEPDKDIKIEEIGLRPGEKLYEELLVKTEELDKTENSLIFIEKDKPLSIEEMNEKLEKLKAGITVGEDPHMKDIIKSVVPTFVEKEKANEHFDGKEVKDGKDKLENK